MSLQSSHYGEEIEFERINPPIRGSIVSATTVIVCGPMETTTKCINPPIRGSIVWSRYVQVQGNLYQSPYKGFNRSKHYATTQEKNCQNSCINPPIRGSIGLESSGLKPRTLSINPPIRGSIGSTRCSST